MMENQRLDKDAHIKAAITATHEKRKLQAKENQRLKERYPDEFVALYAEEMAKPSFAAPESFPPTRLKR
jgi:hypothetical protein